MSHSPAPGQPPFPAPQRRKAARRGAAALAGLALAALTAAGGWAADAEKVTTSYGYTYFGTLHYPADYSHLDYVNPDAPKGGEISIWAPGTFDSFNLYTRKGVQGALSAIGHESIMTAFADDTTTLYCLLCSTLEYPQSKDWVIFHLRPEVRFSDGRPMTAEDVKFTFEEFMAKGLPSFRAAFGDQISDVEVIDPHTVKFNFTPQAPRRDVIGLAGGLPVFSKSWFQETGYKLDESSLTPILGTGPYQLSSFDAGRRIVYKRNPDYWGNDLPQSVGRFNFDTIRVEYFADSSAAFEAFKSGVYTFRNENSSKDWATNYDFPKLKDGYVKKEEIHDGNLAYGQSWVFNLRLPKFQDRRVREAIGLLFNFEWSNETLFYGLYARVTSFWGNSDMEAAGKPTEGEIALLKPLVDAGLADASLLTDDAVLPPVSGKDQLDRKNLRKASHLLDAAGWIVGDDGLRRKDGQVLSVAFLESSPAFDRIINPYVQNLRAVGIDARLDRVDPSQETDRARNYDFDMTNHGFSMELEPSTGLKQWFGCDAMEGSTRNLMGYCDPAADKLIAAIVAAKTKDEMKTGVRALDRVLRAKLFWVPEWFKDVYTVAYYDQYRHPDKMPDYDLGYLDFWWYDAAAAKRLKDAGAL